MLHIKKKKLLFTAYDLNVGGIETALINLLNVINYDKYNVTLILENKQGTLLKKVNKNVQIKEYRLSKNKNIILRKTINLSKRIIYYLFNRNTYDFSCCYATYSLIGNKLTRISSSNNSIYIHGDYTNVYPEEKEFRKFFDRREIDKFRKVFFVSNESMNNFLKKYPKLRKKSLVVNNFINEEEIKLLSNKKINETKIHDKLFVFVGRLDEKSKQITKLLEVIEYLKNKFSIELWIIGDGNDKTKYKKIINEKKLNENIKMLGMKENPFPYMKMADYIIMTSKYEGFPVVYMESIVLNKKLITTINVSDQFISIPNNLGYIISKDTDKMKCQIEEILKNDELEYNKLDMKIINREKIEILEKVFDEVV